MLTSYGVSWTTSPGKKWKHKGSIKITLHDINAQKISGTVHLQSTINIVGDKVVGGFPLAADPDNLTSKPLFGRT